MKKPIYIDYAATTPVDGDCISAALPYYNKIFYNPSSTHVLGQKAAAAVERARTQCASAINADSSEIYFTSGGTEAINWAMSAALCTDKTRIAVSAIEHDAVLASADAMQKDGFVVDYIKPNAHGIITPDALKSVITNDTALVCVMTVNNIVGSVQPIKELATVAHEHGALFFTDAVQAVNSTEIDVKDADVDLLAVSGHKFYAPKGVGFLYKKSNVKINPSQYGGEQERGLRAGTHDVPSVVAVGEAITKAVNNRAEYNEHIGVITAEFLRILKYGTPVVSESGTGDIISVIFDGINGGRLSVALSCAGLCCSVGAACSAGSATPPRTIIEMGIKNPECSVRFSFGRYMTLTQARAAARIVNATVKRLTAATSKN